MQLARVSHGRQFERHDDAAILLTLDAREQRVQLLHGIHRRVDRRISDDQYLVHVQPLAQADRVAVLHLQRPEQIVGAARSVVVQIGDQRGGGVVAGRSGLRRLHSLCAVLRHGLERAGRELVQKAAAGFDAVRIRDVELNGKAAVSSGGNVRAPHRLARKGRGIEIVNP